MSAQTTPQNDPNYEVFLRLTFNEISFVLAALGKAPFEQVEGLVGKVRTQTQAALYAAEKHAANNAVTEEITGE